MYEFSHMNFVFSFGAKATRSREASLNYNFCLHMTNFERTFWTILHRFFRNQTLVDVHVLSPILQETNPISVIINMILEELITKAIA